MEAVDGDAVIEVRTEGGRLTVNVMALLFTPCADALIWEVPAETPLASPVSVDGCDALVGARPGEHNPAHRISTLVISHSGELLGSRR